MMASMPKFEILSAFFMLCLSFASAERDFNFNDSQISLLEPRDEPINRYNQDPYAAEVARCHYTESEIVLSLVLKNHDWSNLSDNKKSKVLDKLSKFFAIPKEFIIMESVTKRELYEIQKQSIRKGNNKCHSNRHLGRVDLMIGCGPKYFSMGEPIANQIGQQMKDGSIDSITGEQFGWWIVWRKSYKSRAQRNRRQIEGSGEDDYEDDSYDYDDDEEDNVEPVTEIPTTTTHAHRHHHGASKPDLTETSSNELTNNNVDAVASNALLENNNNNNSNNKNNNKNNSNHQIVASNIDEEIVESVSQLESVITKTIENTKHIKELPVLPVDDDEVDAEEEEPEDISVIDESAAASAAAALPVDVVDKTADLQQFVLTSSTTPEILTTTSSSNSGSSSTAHDSYNKFAFDSNLERLNGLAAPINVVDINESTALSASTTVTVALEQTTTTETTTTTTSTPFSTLLTSSFTPQAPQSQPQPPSQLSPYSPYDASLSSSPSSSSSSSSNSSVVVVSSYPSTSSSSSISSSLSSSSSASSSPSTTTMQSKEESEDGATQLPDENEETNAVNASVSSTTTPKNTDASDSFNELTPLTTTSTTPSTTTAIPTTSSTTYTLPEATTPMSTSVSTDYVEPKVENTPPMIKTRLQKFAVTSGKAFRYNVPAETFYDAEDLTNLRLELTDKDGHELKPTSWLQFNAETHEIYGLPLDDAVSKWTYRLSATDSGNLSVTETLEMSVQQHRGVRSVNHEINIAVKINEKNMPNIDWQMKLIRAIATTLDDETTTHLVVREIRQTQQDPSAATFIYFNETLPTSGACPDAELNTLIQRLDVNRLTDLLYPTLGIKSITGQLIGPCQKQHLNNKPKLPTHMSKNLPPMPRNQVDRVNATVGHLLVFKVPSDTFYDPNDNELTLSLKTKDNRELSPRHWLQFDTKNQEFYGIPKSGDIGSEEYLLVAEDNGGLTAADALVVVVNHAPKKEFSVYFKAYLAIRHEQFNADLQRKFVERLTQLFGDHTTQFIQIRSITTHHDADGTIVNFYNTTLHKTHNRCPEEETEATRNVYLMQDYMVRDRVKHALGAELNLTNVQVIPLGSCHSQPNVHHDIIPTKTEEPTLKSTFAENYMFTFIVPAVIIVALILVASIIACCLHRRRMSGKMELGDEEERKSFRPKGIPVIFQDELDEKPEIGNKSPIILKDEKPPLLPPSYNTSNMNGENDVDEYVPPPAVVVGGREARGKSPATPSYRKPPPYVSP